MLDTERRHCTSRPPWNHSAPSDETPPELLGVVIWRGRQWAATTYGLERLDGRFPISDRNFGMGWIADISTRRGIDIADFVAAFGVACTFHSIKSDEATALFRALCTRHGLNGFTNPKGRPSTRAS